MFSLKCPKFLLDAGYTVFLTDQPAESSFRKVVIIGIKSE